MRRLRDSKSFKTIAVFVAANLIFQMGLPTVSFALTSGPAQEEFASFEPATTTDMVDLYSGDFTYNIPLLSVPGPNGGYPINLSYHSGVGMEQEASWVGLGWNINVGAINRQLRGLPDDFNGDQITYDYDFKDNTTVGLDMPKSATYYYFKDELFGFAQPALNTSNFNWQIYYNNYKGLGYRLFANFGAINLAPEFKTKNNLLNLGLTLDSQNGIGISPGISLSSNYKEASKLSAGLTLSANYNNRDGLKDVGVSTRVSGNFGKRSNVTDNGDSYSGSNDEKAKSGIKGISSSSSLSFAQVHSVPQATLPFATTVTPFNISIGDAGSPFWWGEYSSSFPNGWSGFENTTSLANGGSLTANGYGYLNTHNAAEDDVKDFTRDPIEYSDKVPNLAPSSYTYDLYTYTGQGAGGMFRPYRNQVDVLTDQYRVNTSHSSQKNLEFAASPGKFHVGLGFPSENGATQSGRWEDGNNLNVTPGSTNEIVEEAYFQEYGEKTGFEYQNTNEDQLYNWNDDQAVRLDLQTSGSWLDRGFEVTNVYKEQSSSAQLSITDDEHAKSITDRQKRGKVIHRLTNAQAENYGLSKNLKYRDANGVIQDKFPNARKSYHISEIEVIEPDGMRYVYGLPAYNNVQIDETMATNATSTTGTVPSISSTSNNNTRNEYRSRTDLPEYVHSWMLTAVFSADYVDVTGDGPTEDDLGYYTKFNYQKVADDYQWRLPYTGGAFIEGTNSDDDNMVSYSYGTKEVFFLRSIETKTHSAIFNTSPRDDGYEADGQYAGPGGIGTQTMRRLDQIQLFSKNELNQTNPVPIKTVNFTYDYTLCPGVPNNSQGGGKLTLKELNFTYENSNRGALSPYKFHYNGSNRPYNRMTMDRWGNFKDISVYPAHYQAELYPYNDQDVASNDVAPWDITSIDLPTGGTLNVNYEEDDYSFVEGEKPMKMFDVIGVDGVTQPTSYSNRFNAQDLGDITGTRVYFALEEPVSGIANPAAYVKEKYFNQDLTQVYFKILIDLLDNNTLPSDKFDYVAGYAEVDYGGQFGLAQINTTGTTYDAGYFDVKEVELSSTTGGSVHPFSKAAYQHLQLQRTDLIYGATAPSGGNPLNNILSVLSSSVALFNDLISTITGFNVWCKTRGYGETIALGGESIVRLYDEDQIKQGGGSRVSRLTINDNWDNDEDGALENAEYGQVYDYTLPNGLSSGVAYEPRMGGEESALRKPITYSESTPLKSTTQNLFVEEPLMESYYPGQSVGYSKVTVSSIAPELAYADNNTNNLLVSSAPITVYEFYTPKDFPVWADQTDLSNDPDILRPLMVPGIYTNFKKKRARSQGYSVVLNDMAGKQKAVTQRTRPNLNNPSGEVISKEEYIYQTQSPYSASKPNYLDNRVKTLNEDGTYTTAVIGQSHDIFIDMNENRETSKSRTIEFNIEFQTPFLLAIVPIPYWGDMELSTKTVVTNKIIHRTGILKEVITTTDESVIKQQNLAFDIHTGTPLLTQVTNEYKDPIYSHSIPAHWYYAGMEGAYQNIDYAEIYSGGRTTSTGSGTEGYLVVDHINHFHEGDELGVIYYPSGPGERVYVVEKDVTNSRVRLMYPECGYVDNQTISSAKIIRSGHRNHLTATAGSVVSKAWDFKTTPPASLDLLYVDGSNQSQVIDADALEFRDHWQYNPDCFRCEGNPINPYTSGELGNWRFFKSHKFVDNRLYAGQNANRTNGVYNTFIQFDWVTLLNPSWQLANEVTRYSPYGFEVENVDALGNYSAGRYGYESSLNVAVAYNARQMEVGVNNFEDDPFDCNKHFNFVSTFNNQEAHTGNVSLEVDFLAPHGGYSANKSFSVLDPLTDPLLQPGTNPIETIDVNFIAGKTYVISAWVKQKAASPDIQYTTYDLPYIEIDFGGVPSAVTLLPSGKIIEGWQRIEGEFTPQSAGTLQIKLGRVNGGNDQVFFDDVRTFPKDANMKSFVYDNISLKLAAELDENNYATFYIYDEQGGLAKIKRETKDGIKTISTGRSSNVIQ
ncbi:MAG: hypothetical protein KDD41_03995 [Flavobacteriales bacterium]|nr:hypothetical protein [Flavobacteriales bacterium]